MLTPSLPNLADSPELMHLLSVTDASRLPSPAFGDTFLTTGVRLAGNEEAAPLFDQEIAPRFSADPSWFPGQPSPFAAGRF